MDARRSSISCEVDFEQKGRQISFLRLLYSDNKHAYGVIPVPIAVIANGEGPTILLAGGTHGDEYEGQLILRRMIHGLDPNSVSGRVIIMPSLNYPAVLASEMNSPLDDGNMNRVFPGEADGSPTLAVANFVDSTIFPLCDAAIDFHSGGRKARCLPCIYLCKDSNPGLMARRLAMTEAFAAPLTVVVGATAARAAVDLAAANGHGVAAISTELGGSGGVNPQTL
ncbi:MAG: succinylglutamate desuccinylase/aspartoacylase family protein, partial [Candidatus Latescibacteria bacterium]|nr:succinylglutamate desuccinylase/aspartoacylase family protein [Candidatus Latescibacterota bacterium]